MTLSLKRCFLRLELPHVQCLQLRTFFGNTKKKSGKNDSHLHAYLLKDGNKHMIESPLLSINDYDQAIEIEETSESFTKRAFGYFHIKDYDQALTDISHAMKLNPRSIEALCCAASIEVAKDDHERALYYLTEAYDLTSPMDFRLKSIEEVMNGCKLTLRVNAQTMKGMPVKEENIVEAEIINDDTQHYNQPIFSANGINVRNEEQLKLTAEKMVDMPFTDSNFMNLQKDITQQMVDIGGEEFQAKLMKLNEIPAVQMFQKKALSGEKPDYDDYMLLMKDAKFQKYNAVMTQISQDPKFSSVTEKFAVMDWMGAYEELKKDPAALQLYMKAFDEI